MKPWAVLPLLAAAFLASCAGPPKPQWLMPTPVLYQDGRVDPFGHLGPEMRHTGVEVFYTTNRKPQGDHYGNDVNRVLHFGTATMKLGEPGDDWEDLVLASTTDPRPKPMPVNLVSSREIGTDEDPAAVGQWAREVDRALRGAQTREIVLYVHGAKVGFHHSCAFAAELDHFCGRDLVPVAFDWPTHQEIWSYVDGIDVDHARRSSGRLAETIRVLADGTRAEQIHIVSWSAGARVHSRALAELAGEGMERARRRYRLGVMAFAAGDVPVGEFLERLPAIHGLSERVLVYMSDGDGAVKWSSRLMGGGRRLGMVPEELSEEEIAALRAMPRLEAIDTSYGKDRRGFDIVGHRYWFQHPWVNSDLVLALRTGAPAEKRGLRPAPQKGAWWFGEHYPQRIGKVGRGLTGGEW